MYEGVENAAVSEHTAVWKAIAKMAYYVIYLF